MITHIKSYLSVFIIINTFLLMVVILKISKNFEPEANPLMMDQAVQELQSDKSDTMVDRVTPQLSKNTMWLKTQADIREDIVNTCNKLGPALHFPLHQGELFYHSGNNLAACLNAKVGTSTMMRHFQRMIPEHERPEKIDREGRQRISSYLSPQRSGLNTSSVLKTAVSFSVVRHPFERFVSAYQNKMVEEEGPIKRRFLKIYPAGTFSDFADYVLKLARVHCRSYGDCKLNNHWLPFLSRCAYCTANYTVVAKLETLDDDLFYIGEMVGITFDNIEANVSGGVKTSISELAKQYFSQLDDEVAWQLYKLYQPDFQLFGYKATEYLGIASNNSFTR